MVGRAACVRMGLVKMTAHHTPQAPIVRPAAELERPLGRADGIEDLKEDDLAVSVPSVNFDHSEW